MSDEESEEDYAQEEDNLEHFFQLPKIILPIVKRTTKGEPCIDYSKSLWMT